MSHFPLKIGMNTLCRQADGICSVFMMPLNNLHDRICIRKLPIIFHASAGISSSLNYCLPTFPIECSPSLSLFLPRRYFAPLLGWVYFFCVNSLVFFIHQHVNALTPSLLACIVLLQHFSCCAFDIAYLTCVIAWSIPCSSNSIYLLLSFHSFQLIIHYFNCLGFHSRHHPLCLPFDLLYSTLSFSSPVLF